MQIKPATAAERTPISLHSEVTAEIRAELARRQLGQKFLVGVWGISQPAVAIKLAGKSEISDRQIEQAALAFGFDPFDLVARAGRNSVRPQLVQAA